MHVVHVNYKAKDSHIANMAYHNIAVGTCVVTKEEKVGRMESFGFEITEKNRGIMVRNGGNGNGDEGGDENTVRDSNQLRAT